MNLLLLMVCSGISCPLRDLIFPGDPHGNQDRYQRFRSYRQELLQGVPGRCRYRNRWRQRSDRPRNAGSSAQVRLGTWQSRRGCRRDRGRAVGGREVHQGFQRTGPRPDRLAGAGRRSGAGVHRALYQGGSGWEALARQCPESHHFCAGKGRRHHHLRRSERRQVRRVATPHRFERLVHHQLPVAGGQGASRILWNRARADDHRAFLHQRPEAAGPAAPGSAAAPVPRGCR